MNRFDIAKSREVSGLLPVVGGTRPRTFNGGFGDGDARLKSKRTRRNATALRGKTINILTLQPLLTSRLYGARDSSSRIRVR